MTLEEVFTDSPWRSPPVHAAEIWIVASEMSYLKTIKPIFVILAPTEYSQLQITDEGKSR